MVKSKSDNGDHSHNGHSTMPQSGHGGIQIVFSKPNLCEPYLLISLHYEIRENCELIILIPGYVKNEANNNTNMFKRRPKTFVENVNITHNIRNCVFPSHAHQVS